MTEQPYPHPVSRESKITIPLPETELQGTLAFPDTETMGLVLIVSGVESTHKSPYNQYLGHALGEFGLATLQLDLVSENDPLEEEDRSSLNSEEKILERLHHRALRLNAVTDWVSSYSETAPLNIGYVGFATGATVAFQAVASQRPLIAGAIVSIGGRVDMASQQLKRVRVPTLLIAGEQDLPTVRSNEKAYEKLDCEKDRVIVAKAGHLLEEDGAMETALRLSANWFLQWLPS